MAVVLWLATGQRPNMWGKEEARGLQQKAAFLSVSRCSSVHCTGLISCRCCKICWKTATNTALPISARNALPGSHWGTGMRRPRNTQVYSATVIAVPLKLAFLELAHLLPISHADMLPGIGRFMPGTVLQQAHQSLPGLILEGSTGAGTLPPLMQSIMKYVSMGDSCTFWKKSLTCVCVMEAQTICTCVSGRPCSLPSALPALHVRAAAGTLHSWFSTFQ